MGQIQLLLRWQWRQQPVGGEYTIPVSVLMVVDEGGRQQRRRWRAAVGGGRQCQRQWTGTAGSLLPHCCWRRQGNRWRTMDDGRLKVGGRQNYLLTISWEHSGQSHQAQLACLPYLPGHKKHLKDKVQRSKSFLFSCRVKCQECMGTT